MIGNKSTRRNLDKNREFGWSLLSVSSEPSLYLNIQVDGEVMLEVALEDESKAHRIGRMIVGLPKSLIEGGRYDTDIRSKESIWKDGKPIGEDRDLWRVEGPTWMVCQILERVNRLLKPEQRVDVKAQMGIQVGNYGLEAQIRMNLGQETLVVNAELGRYAVVEENGDVYLYEENKWQETLKAAGAAGIFRATEWVTFAAEIEK